MAPLTKVDIENRLLSYLRNSLSIHDIEFIQPPVLYKEGRRLRTYKFRITGAPKEYSRSLVLRLYPPDEIPVRPHCEGILLNTLHEQNIPVPRTYFMEDNTEYLTAPFLIMDEVRGELLFDINSIITKPYMQAARFLISGVGSIARDLAAVAVQIHTTPVDTLYERLKTLKFPIEHLSLNGRLYQLYKRVQNAKLTELEPGVIWLISHGPPETVKPSLCHGQLYPHNIRKLGDNTSGIINWSMDSVLIGDSAYDIGRTSAAFKCLVPNVSSRMIRLSYNVGKRFAKQFVHHYRQQRQVSLDKIKYFEMMWCIDLATSAGESVISKSHIYKKEFEEARVDLYKSAANAVEYFKNSTGVSVMLPLLRR
jgi:aminoglycoside phosphotransferase (APT) family kinase protein